jgi:hypothetical protein
MLVLGKLRQENHEASLGYTGDPLSRKTISKQTNNK